MFEKSTKKFADRPLFGVKKAGVYQWTTYREIAKKVDDLRGGLATLGVGPGDRVAVIADNRPEWAIAAYAVYGLGAQYVPMYEAQLPKEWEYILKDSGTKLVFGANDKIVEKLKPMLASAGGVATLEHVINFAGTGAGSFEGLLATGRDRPKASLQPKSSDVCGFIYTSGTTGNPKGVLLTHANITSNINAVHQIFPMAQDDVSLSFLPWAHSFGQTCELHCLLSYGASMGLAESVSTIIDNLAEVRPTLLFSVPRIFNRIYDGVNKRMNEAGGLKLKLFNKMLEVAKTKKNLEAMGKSSFLTNLQFKVLDKVVASKVRARFGGRLKYAFSGGAALSKEVGEFIDNLGITVYEGYGLTETSPVATANSPLGRKIGSIGRPIPGVRVEIVPVDVAPEGQGEIIIYGPNVMLGYHNLPEDTAASIMSDGGFRTGDMGRKDQDGFIYITGRVKEQYKLENGKYVAPAPLEEKLRLSPFIANIMVDGTNRPYNVAVIVPDFESLEKYAKDSGLAFATRDELVARPEVVKLFLGEVQKYGAEFKGFERPERFVLATEDFTTDNNMLTPSLKVKRRNVMAKYGEQIAHLYKG
ncbi:MAG: long-chain fatty acid--CoA ligase [Deltaproteobacteria bacterium]|nr:long-chain fatty acid--CoA ligase [Deltaproteobacteria bacterium]